MRYGDMGMPQRQPLVEAAEEEAHIQVQDWDWGMRFLLAVELLFPPMAVLEAQV